ncbi:MAG: nickel-dependent lactate racemase [Ruminococcaceae bacterium]|nr:nickel-dependent lactate racemase [Oscillospiraceae bacterium]
MVYEFGFGKEIQKVDIPDNIRVRELTANKDIEFKAIDADVVNALENPIGSKRLRDIVNPGEKIAIITSDITRPMPTYKVMPALIEELEAGGVNPSDITLVFALGSHRKQTPDEQKRLAGEYAYNKINVVDSDIDDCVHMGVTSSGTPVDITRVVAEADRKIALGNIEFHYFAGYSGGYKAIMPGVSTPAAIQSNHKLMIRPESCAGRLEGNPVREDIEEAGALCGLDFILNVVLDEHKNIVKVVCGDPIKAHREGAKFLDKLYTKEIDCGADIVIVSQGGAPKDLNLYQTQKALDNSKHAVKDGGIIILIGSCAEGYGEHTFEDWMLNSESPDALVNKIRENFVLGGHKAAAIGMVLQRAEIYLVSDMDPELVKRSFMKPYTSAQQAFDDALAKLGKSADVITMPYGGSVLPRVK